MLRLEPSHAAHVDAWLASVCESAPPAKLIALFETALGALWRRAEVTLGEVTLTAILDRVVYTSAEIHPFLSSLTIVKTGIRFDEFREQGATHADLRDGIRLVLVSYLTVLGHLTDEILTPALHAELAKLGGAGLGPAGNDDGPEGARS